jgi:hypothetical protein
VDDRRQANPNSATKNAVIATALVDIAVATSN